MKIIGKTERGYIIDISGDELANLAGYYAESQSPSAGYNRGPYNVGDTVTVHKMYHQLYNLARISAQADQAKKTLQAAIELFTIVDPVVRQITEEKSEVPA